MAVAARKSTTSALGAMIRHARQRDGLTLQELSAKCALSVGFLSLVERGLASPSLGSLAVIAQALALPISTFLEVDAAQGAITREGERSRIAIEGSPLDYERLSTVFPGQSFDAVRIHVPPGYTSETVCHAGEEWIYVLAGELTQRINSNTYILRPGDTCHFRGEASHSYANDSAEPLTLLWVGTMPVFKRAGDSEAFHP
ncbi:MAG: cupin domain-containing protein [Proteobacteria bacterium]|nr:cupin domain-containing protein [Pseudomonadota bacterium]